jgi:hypothetical protein
MTELAAILDFNHRPKQPSLADRINGLIDGALVGEDRARPGRTYLGGSRLGDPCARRLQYEYLGVPKDDGAGFCGLQLRIFSAGHAFEDLAVAWLRSAGFDLRTHDRAGAQFGFSVAGGRIQGHIDGVIVGGPDDLVYPALWECKSANARSWREMVKRGVAVARPIYAAQIALYQAYMGLTEAPALFTVVNKDTSELWHEAVPFAPELAQAASDKAVRILQASAAGEWLPRIAANPDHPECARCSWKGRCWA